MSIITDEMVEAAARAIIAAQQKDWIEPAADWTVDQLKLNLFWQDASSALTAVAPLIEAQERERCARIADVMPNVAVNRFIINGSPLRDDRGNEHFVALSDMNAEVRKLAQAIRSRA